MSIFEYNEELALSYIREDEYQKGHEDGRIQGEAIKLIDQVCKKMKKGKPAEIIAEELEEKPSVVEGIYRIAEEYGTDDCNKIYERLIGNCETFEL